MEAGVGTSQRTPPALGVVISKLEDYVKEAPRTRQELIAWLDDSTHPWLRNWKGQLSAHVYVAVDKSKKTAIAALGEHQHIFRERVEGGDIERYVFRSPFSCKTRAELETVIRESRTGIQMSKLVESVKSDYPDVAKDVAKLLKDGRIFAVDEDLGNKKVLFSAVERGRVANVYHNADLRKAYREVLIPERNKMLDALQKTDNFKLPDEIYRRKRSRNAALATNGQQNAAKPRKRRRPQVRTNAHLAE